VHELAFALGQRLDMDGGKVLGHSGVDRVGAVKRTKATGGEGEQE
jgi:hypothetical protein